MRKAIQGLFLTIALFWVHFSIIGQSVKPSASDLLLSLKKLNALGSVLYVAAHPDDENTRLIAYLSNEAKLNTAYLSITRGDGGQNLIGPEIREMLGIIRTQELLQARRVDGGQQFFTRANDFGYSKSPEETLQVWDKEKVLSDVVWVIRKFQPDVIITRFPGDGRGGHGHHTASAMLAQEAFDIASDPSKYPEQLEYVAPWQPKTLLFNTTSWFYRNAEFDVEGLISVDVGAYNHLLGKSYTEIAAESRSMHKSQGFGATGTRGSTLEYLEHVKGEKITDDFLTGSIKSWKSLEGAEELSTLFNRALNQFDPEQPAKITPILLEANRELESLKDPYWKKVKSDQLKGVLRGVLGLYLEASTSEESVAPGEHIKIRLEATNRSNVPVSLDQIPFDAPELDIDGTELLFNYRFEQELEIMIPEDQPFSQPYWLRSTGSLGMFDVSDPLMIGKPENQAPITIPFKLNIAGEHITYEVPLMHKSNDPVKGEVFQPLAVTPPVAINFRDKVQVFADKTPRTFQVTVKGGLEQLKGELSLEVPGNWKVAPDVFSFELSKKGEEQQFTFTITPPDKSGEGKIKAVAKVGEQRYSMERVNIAYDHIPHQVLFPEAAAKVVKLDIYAGGHNIGYVMGAGDDIPSSLRQIGYNVELLEMDNLNPAKLSKYTAIILGIRALNTVERLKFQMETLLAYAEKGGTLIVQYNTSHRLVTNEFAPYPLQLSRDRVSVEDASVQFLKPDHRILNYPNKITSADFDGWIQERGLYFPNQWDQRYQAILSTNDPGESPKHGGVLVAEYGKGYYIYTGLSWFRELPAGVPGAFRLFANMISIGLQEPDN
jgi:LmbE family N-acetylglucosaminyl deacetylase